MARTVKWTKKALGQLTTILRHIAAHNPAAAAGLRRKLTRLSIGRSGWI